MPAHPASLRAALLVAAVAWVCFGGVGGALLAALVLADPTPWGLPRWLEAAGVAVAGALVPWSVAVAALMCRDLKGGAVAAARGVAVLTFAAGLWPLAAWILVASLPAAPAKAPRGPVPDPLDWDALF